MTTSNNGKEEKNALAVEPLVEGGSAYAPDVDILEDEGGLTVLLDLPGVAQGEVNVEVDENFILTVKAKNAFAEPEGEIARQFGIGNYHRVFQLSEEIDREKVRAKLENGVLALALPKREDAKPKRIAIKA